MRVCQSLRQLSVTVLVFILGTSLTANATDNKHPLQQGSSGISWAMQAIAALTGGNPVNSVIENGSIQATFGNDQEMGTVTLQSAGVMISRMDVTTPTGTRSQIRTITNGHPDGTLIGIDGIPHPMAAHNCWTDAVWFFPALSLLADYANQNLVFTDIGPEQYNGVSVEHVQVYRTKPGLSSYRAQILARLSTVDFYLDSQTAIPVAFGFAGHSDSDLNINIPVEAVFSDYQPTNGVLVPMQVNLSLGNTSFLQISISSVTLNGPVGNAPIQ